MRRLSSYLFALGATIGVLASVGLALGFRPSQLPAGLLDITVYKLAFIATGGVLAAGAMIRRSDRRRRERDATASEEDARALASGAESELRIGKMQRERERRPPS